MILLRWIIIIEPDFQLKSKLKNINGDPEVEYFRKGSAASYLSVSDLDKVVNTKFCILQGLPQLYRIVVLK